MMNIDASGAAYAASVAETLGRLMSRPLTAATDHELELIVDAGLDLARCAVAEKCDRRDRPSVPAAAGGGLRLVADGGELTAAGERSLRARHAARARWGRSA